MTVKELIGLLQEMPQDLDVLTEGCDCWGSASSVVVVEEEYVEEGYGDSPIVLIKRQ